ncbi:hypothetical protein PLICRDRAFT_454387 [Plicaturopsis crispa FD-325 SS-3]|uniref:Unplaced genomic scaffold PLICRscaffold_26, whole genome shotgun sequence n=1 Tax=Plicaturopsis crispa FD-325 SS-3 TaxID=944288 RepID=A0A0C9SK85_PLICR|nr:hypothetical protein PLICRDRAFT_454387 [Plicaturopsis crispa FD-325 SS-3]
MSSEGVSSTANIIGIATGIFALLGFVFYRDHLPTARLKRLDELIKETQESLDQAVEENTLPDPSAREDIRRRLRSIRDDAHEHRRRTYRAMSLVDQYREFLRGLSWSIERTCREAEYIRMDLTDAIDRRRVEELLPLDRTGTCRAHRRLYARTVFFLDVDETIRLRPARAAPTIHTADHALLNLNSLSLPATLYPEARIPLPDEDDSLPASPDSEVPRVYFFAPFDEQPQDEHGSRSEEAVLDSLLEVPKRKRGRPKGSKNRKPTVPDEEEEYALKRMRRKAGLPPGSEQMPLLRPHRKTKEREAVASSSAIELDHDMLQRPTDETPAKSSQRRPYRAR